MSEVKSQLAERLRQLRGTRTLYQVEQESGISRSLIRRYENGTHIPEEQMLRRIAEYYEFEFPALRKLHFAALFPEGSEIRKTLFEWVDEIRSG